MQDRVEKKNTSTWRVATAWKTEAIWRPSNWSTGMPPMPPWSRRLSWATIIEHSLPIASSSRISAFANAFRMIERDVACKLTAAMWGSTSFDR
jgi:hypothetical protein